MRSLPVHSKGLNDRLKEGESYTGTGGCKLQITERKGETVKAVWTWKKRPPEKDQVIQLAGVVTSPQLLLESSDQHFVISGDLQGDKLVLKYKGPKLATKVEFIIP